MKISWLVLSVFTCLSFVCAGPDPDPKIVRFDDSQRRAELKAYLEKKPDSGVFGYIFIESQTLSETDTLKAKIFMANNVLDAQIKYPLGISYSVQSESDNTNTIKWSAAYVVKDTGYVSIPVKTIHRSLYKNTFFHTKILLHLKNGQDTTFNVMAPVVIKK